MSETVIPLVLFALVSTSTPGIATTLSTASGAQFGFRRSVPLMAGSAAGLASVAAAGAAGLAGLLTAVPSLQLAMKIAGSIYLIWLALKIGRSGPPNLDVSMARPNSFFGGAGIQWMNPKGWAMGLGAAASFAALADSPVQLALLLGSVFGLAAAFSLSLWCVAGTLLARLLKTERQWRALNIVLGLLLAASILQMWRPA
ncbi:MULTISPECIES: LysE family translocator [unclassified Mesorhizobium]|uniref:LysE family translocator n=1 Tax=unclassified Mesorhizobium TaxID=325217 RepID=UPI000BB002CB|nr:MULTISPECIES: LysE family translocator [unclassified Mesorhizobium]TGT57349.1 LysE family translocator [Mesorhizobium sp. M00.F.Ca.ET.170.01.1.1]AZO11918.1 LysE family translocator [Mesorhizobium sp. M3A.F.Ca.ET.080.04.2.1]PBB86187.1 amino acid transporter [Mesorhizobium sp. WSM3876]RWB73201.1 MAG: LysE family translocator [Mesorhizobium sp.]RWB83250.1 MAG: LysE family translocator [Mesorhizobium sp.]